MQIKETLASLENSWSREKVLPKLQNGISSEDLIEDFFFNNQKDIEKLSKLLGSEDKKIFRDIEKLINAEAKLINKINIFLDVKANSSTKEKNNKTQKTKILYSSKLSSLMIKWSNRFIVIALLTISAISITKQAWS